MFLKNKGQSALEYLMTYGWALVVIVVVIAALVLLMPKTNSERCEITAGSGILISNHKVSDSNITLVLSNQTGFSLSNVSVSVSGTVGGTSTSGSSTISTLGTTGATTEVTLTPAPTVGASYNLQVSFSYNDRDGLARSVTSTCTGAVSS